MASQIAALQLQLWILTGIVFVLTVATVLCNYRNFRKNDDYRRMKRMAEAGRYEKLLAYVDLRLRLSPNNKFHLVYRAKALIHLARLDEAEEIAETLKNTSSAFHNEAVNLLDSIADLRTRSS